MVLFEGTILYCKDWGKLSQVTIMFCVSTPFKQIFFIIGFLLFLKIVAVLQF